MLRRAIRTSNPILWLATGLGAGLAAGWLTAPRRGDWLRNQMRQKIAHWRRLGRRRLERASREVENRARGAVAEVREVWSGRDHYVDANTLVDQVHSEIGREFASTLAHVNLNGAGHTIFLHGRVADERERDRLVRAVRAVDGVEEVREEELRVGRMQSGGAKPRRRPRQQSAG